MSVARTHAVVVNYNAGAWLARCVDALLREEALAALTIVDNASVDDSLAGLPADPRLAVIRNNHNIGFAAAANAGASDVQSDYLAIVNPDLELSSPALERLQQVMDGRRDAGIAGIRIVDPDGSEQRACRRRRPTPLRSAKTLLQLERLGAEGVNIRGPLPAAPTEMEAVSGAFLFVRRRCWEQLGGFDPGFFLHCEDLDLFERARAGGWQILFVPSVTAVHAKGISHGHRRLAAERDKHRGMVRFYRRHFAAGVPRPLRWIWPAVIWIRYGLMFPAWWLMRWRDRSMGNG